VGQSSIPKNCVSSIRHFGGRNFADIRQGATPTPITPSVRVKAPGQLLVASNNFVKRVCIV